MQQTFVQAHLGYGPGHDLQGHLYPVHGSARLVGARIDPPAQCGYFRHTSIIGVPIGSRCRSERNSCETLFEGS